MYYIKQEKEIENLFERIMEELNSENVINNEKEISAFTLKNQLIKGMTKYNDYLVTQIKKIGVLLNKRIRNCSIFKRNIALPYIGNICPGIDNEGNSYIELYLINYNTRFVGKAIITDKLDIKIDNLWDTYNEEELINLIKRDINLYKPFINILNEFKQEYPNIPYQWNNRDNNNNYSINDGFIRANFYLDDLEKTSVSFVDNNDFIISDIHSKKHGKLIDYIDFFPNDFMKKIKVNISDLNPLYQAIVRNQMEIEKSPNQTGEIAYYTTQTPPIIKL